MNRRMRSVAHTDLLLHLLVLETELVILRAQQRSNLGVHSPEIEFIPPRIDGKRGKRNACTGKGGAYLFTRLPLAR